MALDNENDVIRLAQSGNELARLQMLEQYKRLIWKLALKCAPTPNDIDDFVQVGSIMLLHAVEAFDTTRGVKFMSYVYTAIQRKMLKERKTARLIRVPENTHECDDTFQRTGGIASLEFDKEGEGRLAATLTDGYSFFDDVIGRDEVNRLRAAIAQLPDKRRVVMTSRLAGKTLRETGDELSISRERVRQIEADAYEQLKALLNAPQTVDSPRVIRVRPVEVVTNWRQQVASVIGKLFLNPLTTPATSFVCKHSERIRHGRDRNGTQRWKCLKCGVTFYVNHPTALEDMRMRGGAKKLYPVAMLIAEGRGVRDIARRTGVKCDTVTKLYNGIEILAGTTILCSCGRPARHNGWCKFRYANSPDRQKYMKQWRESKRLVRLLPQDVHTKGVLS